MSQNNGNRPRLELNLNESATVTLLREKPTEGTNNYGEYAMLTIQHDGIEKVFFTSPDIAQKISELKIGKGDTIILRKIPFQNGKKLSSKIELEVLQKKPMDGTSSTSQAHADNLKAIMAQCLSEAIDITRSFTDVPFQNDDVRAICSSLFIARTR
jgi:hypothetical protein